MIFLHDKGGVGQESFLTNKKLEQHKHLFHFISFSDVKHQAFLDATATYRMEKTGLITTVPLRKYTSVTFLCPFIHPFVRLFIHLFLN